MESKTLREGLPSPPLRMRSLPLDHRGYCVPWFVAWIDGEPDFRVIRPDGIRDALRFSCCWLCGDTLGKFRTFVIGPMCAINRTTQEPPSHFECAEFAARACPFMVLPRSKRRVAHLPEDRKPMPGIHLDRNPGAFCLWTCTEFRPFRPVGGGQLLRLGEPASVDWYYEGRPATRDEVLTSMHGGLPELERVALAQGGQKYLDEVQSAFRAATHWLPDA